MKRFIQKIQDARDGDIDTVRSAFYIMVAVIILSVAWAVFSKTVVKSDYKRPRPVADVSPPSALSNSFNGVISSATNLVEILEIKSSIDSIVNKDSLSKADSLNLFSAFQKLEFLSRQTNPRTNEEN